MIDLKGLHVNLSVGPRWGKDLLGIRAIKASRNCCFNNIRTMGTQEGPQHIVPDYVVDESIQNSSGQNSDYRPTRQAIANDYATMKDAVFTNGGFPLMLVVASIVLLVAASIACNDICGGTTPYTVAGAVISLLAAAGILFLEYKGNLDTKVRQIAIVLLFVWWVPLTFVTTSSTGAFRFPGNGYFSAWAGLAISLVMLMQEFARFRNAMSEFAKSGTASGILIVGSIVVIIEGIAARKACAGCGEAIFAIASGVITLLCGIISFAIANHIADSPKRVFHICIVAFCAVSFMVLTFFGPFDVAGNGYFGSAAVLFGSYGLIRFGSSETET